MASKEPLKLEEMSATQYVILAENQRKKKALQDVKAKYDALLRENKALLDERAASTEENYNASEFFRKEILRKNEKIVSLESLIEKREEVVKREQEEFLEAAKKRVEGLKADWAEKEAGLNEDIDALKQELEALKDFKERKLEIEEQMERLRVECEELRAGQAARAAELERKFIEQNTKLKKEYEQKLEDLKKSAEEDIDERLDASVKRILQQNRRMAEELRLHVQETDELQREKKVLEEERRRLAREVELKREMEEQYAKRGTKQQREIREQEKKVQSLEKSLGQVVKDFEEEKEKILKQAKGEAGDAASEVSGLQRLLKLRTRELANIRRLASEVVRQRGDVERFLIDSLEAVKKEIVDERVRENSQMGGSGNLPALRGASGEGGSGRSKPSRGGSGRALDISDLGWEDRERVLRLLFSKINSASQASYFAKLPPHSFDVEVRSGAGLSEGGMSGVIDPSGVGMGPGSSPLGGAMSDGFQPGLM